jgi:hypothetical protein
MMSDQAYYLVVMAAEVLLPLIPAFILFKVIPSDATVTGPFQGFTVKLGGAFAGYFVMFLVLNHFFPPPESRYQVWHIRGQASLEGPDKLLESDISVQPIVQVVDGTFRLDFPVEKNEAGVIEFPSLVINPVCHMYTSISLGTKPGGFGGASPDVHVTSDVTARTIQVDGIKLSLDPDKLASDGKTKCKP